MRRAQIDALREADGSFQRQAVKGLLPYGDEFLFVDSVSLLTPQEVIAHYEVPTASPFINAHFVHSPVMPGVLLGESLAQAGVLLLHYHLDCDDETDVVVSAVRSAKFKSPAVPGDILQGQVSIQAVNRLGARLEGRSHVNDRAVCHASFDLVFVSRRELQEYTAQLRGRH